MITLLGIISFLCNRIIQAILAVGVYSEYQLHHYWWMALLIIIYLMPYTSEAKEIFE